MWIIAAIVIAIILMVLLGYYIISAKKTARCKGRGISEGLGIGMLVSAAVCISLRELGGYLNAPDFLLPSGLALGGVIGCLLERRYQKLTQRRNRCTPR
jgi:hypothetical protein